jgi:thiol-disulfide isomerase/thioredoxin
MLMSVSTPKPPSACPQPPADWPESGPEPGVPLELLSEAMFDAALSTYADETYVSVDAAGAVRERPFLVIVEAYSQSCRACIGMRRSFQKCAQAHVADAAFFMFDAQALPQLAESLGIRSLPTFILFKRGARLDHFNASSRDTLEENILDNL